MSYYDLSYPGFSRYTFDIHLKREDEHMGELDIAFLGQDFNPGPFIYS